eukprot:TRINITY_DN41067_c0_g1_i2.p1 TRINITY_DN41067_c0_g1~~TRINITY_DN41067_c0_g1_i2.p1  ORF type:complete len:105 (-),score=6.71 TRINITY_DN41067_c0_g1_i2:212-526(-)
MPFLKFLEMRMESQGHLKIGSIFSYLKFKDSDKTGLLPLLIDHCTSSLVSTLLCLCVSSYWEYFKLLGKGLSMDFSNLGLRTKSTGVQISCSHVPWVGNCKWIR